ncbi:hypothetical protein C6568_12360 [Melaminivora suipulveris]|uniref:Uncharacterized protein n=1 Tax=Melaminivora suipulveris TaxID=2109913 RepID=A0A2R3QDV7_9BURK|nr:hypothetical protein [Melaminivora suipulveris]AVO49955.1 hypothetical protein C6568_12360 [Melaminivora suipulveris]
MNSTTHTRLQAPAQPAARDTAAPSPTRRDEKRVGRWIAILLAIAVLAVLAFNVLAPKDRLRAPDQPPAAATSNNVEQRQQPTTTAPGDGTVQRVTPEAPDSPTPAGREGMGSPAGAVPAVQDAR